MATPSPRPEAVEREPDRADRRLRAGPTRGDDCLGHCLPVSAWILVTMPSFSSKNLVFASDQPPKSLSMVSSFGGVGNGLAGSLAPSTSTSMPLPSGRKPFSA